MSSDEVKNEQGDVSGGDEESSGGEKSRHPKKRVQVKKKQATVNPDIEERVVAVNRVAKVVKGGRRFSFSALMIVGDKKGSVGYGLGKANEVPEAIRKAIQAAHRNMIKVSLDKGTIPHQIIGCHDAGRIIFKPAAEGTGIKAAGACRSILELAGVKNVLTKSVRNNNPHNVVKATFSALRGLRSVEQIAAVRGIDSKRVRIK